MYIWTELILIIIFLWDMVFYLIFIENEGVVDQVIANYRFEGILVLLILLALHHNIILLLLKYYWHLSLLYLLNPLFILLIFIAVFYISLLHVKLNILEAKNFMLRQYIFYFIYY